MDLHRLHLPLTLVLPLVTGGAVYAVTQYQAADSVVQVRALDQQNRTISERLARVEAQLEIQIELLREVRAAVKP